MKLKLVDMLFWSIRLDYIFLFKIPDITIFEKIRFILLKYVLYLKNVIFGLSAPPVSVRIFQRKFYYNDAFGIASLQRIYCEHYTLKRIVNDNPVVIDVGAHIGQFNFFCKQYLKAKRVLSIEPQKECFSLLKLNAGESQDCMSVAVCSSGNEVLLYVSKYSSQHSSCIRNAGEEYSEHTVQSQGLDDIVEYSGFERIDLLKVDTEGSEYDVLLSAQRSLQKVETVLVEMSVARPSSGSLFKTGCLLNDRHYALIELSGIHSPCPSTVDGVFKKVKTE